MAYGFHFAGFALFTVYAYGVLGWIPSFFTRTFAWSIGDVGFRYGLGFLIGGPLGAVGRGALSGWLSKHGARSANGLVMALGVGAIGLFGTAAPMMSDPWISLLLFGAVAFFFALPSGVSLAFLAENTPPEVRGRIVAIYYLAINIAGAALGALAVGLMNDALFGSPQAVGQSLAVLCAATCPTAALLLWLARRSALKQELWRP